MIGTWGVDMGELTDEQHPEDAKLAVQHGVNGIVVSNHGGEFNLD